MRRRIFVSTGEASGELLAVELAGAMRALDPELAFEGIGAQRMADAGFALRWNTRGWASLGPVEALGKIPKLLAIALLTGAELCANPPDLIVLIDFGAFNLRLARYLRRCGYRGRICYYFPPAAWLDDPKRARLVAGATVAVTPFAHQRDFYASLGLPIHWFGHPLVTTIPPRAPRPDLPSGGGLIAILPGSRRGEIARHARLLFEAARLWRLHRPHAEFAFGAADGEAERTLGDLAAQFPDVPARVVRGARAVLADADGAWVASGTAVLEAALLGVPTVAFYVVSAIQLRMARRLVDRVGLRYVTLPNLVLDAPVVPELWQEQVTQTELVTTLERVLADAGRQQAAFARLRAALGPPEALERTAAFAVELAGQC